MNKSSLVGVGVIIAGLALATPAAADTFGSGANSFEIEFVPIGQPGNLPDSNPNPAGTVPYRYRMGVYEISEQMIDKANALGALGITKDTRGPDKPATSVTWFEAARFVNWLNTSTGHPPAYKFVGSSFELWQLGDAGYHAGNPYRNKFARYVLPSLDEWHKAAYYDPAAGVYYDYPTGSDSVPDGIDFAGDPMFDAVFFDGGSNAGPNDIMKVGLISPFGAAGQGGNIDEWDEGAFDRVNDVANDQRAAHGGTWATAHNVLLASHTGSGIGPGFQGNFLGFRVSRIPEPNSLSIASIAMMSVIHAARQRRNR